MCNRAQQRATAVSSGTTRPAKPGIIRSSSHRRRIAPCALSRRSMPRMPCSSFRMVIADKKVSAGATLPAQAATFGSALPVAAFRNSDTTFVQSMYIRQDRSAGGLPRGRSGGPAFLVPLCQRSCRPDRMESSGGARTKTWPDTDKLIRTGIPGGDAIDHVPSQREDR